MNKNLLIMIWVVLIFLGVVSASIGNFENKKINPLSEVTFSKNAYPFGSVSLYSSCSSNNECDSSYCGSELSAVFDDFPNYCTDFCDEKTFCSEGVCRSLDSTIGYCVECLENRDCVFGNRCEDFKCVGAGGMNDPIEIYTCEDLQMMNSQLGGSFGPWYLLMNDIDCSETINWNDGKGFDPIGDLDNPFIGKFNGRGYAISNLYINRSDEDYVGLFGYVGPNGYFVSNVTLADSIVVGNNYVGGLVGYGEDANVEGNSMDCSIYGNDYVGGLMGKGSIDCDGCFSKDSFIVGNDYVGGIIGDFMRYLEPRPTELYFSGSIEGNKYVGGIFGRLYAGGVILSDSYSEGSISAYRYAGGLIGSLSRTTLIVNSYSTIETEGETYIGSLVGYSLGGVVNNSFSIGGIFYNGPVIPDFTVIGNSDGAYSNLYFYNGSENSPEFCLRYGSTDENCVAISDKTYFYDSSNAPMSTWDFDNVWVEVQRGLPIFRWQAEDKDCLNDEMCSNGKKCYNFECVHVADIGATYEDSNKQGGGSSKINAPSDDGDDKRIGSNNGKAKNNIYSEEEGSQEGNSIDLTKNSSLKRKSFISRTVEWVGTVVNSIKNFF